MALSMPLRSCIFSHTHIIMFQINITQNLQNYTIHFQQKNFTIRIGQNQTTVYFNFCLQIDGNAAAVKSSITGYANESSKM